MVRDGCYHGKCTSVMWVCFLKSRRKGPKLPKESGDNLRKGRRQTGAEGSMVGIGPQVCGSVYLSPFSTSEHRLVTRESTIPTTPNAGLLWKPGSEFKGHPDNIQEVSLVVIQLYCVDSRF